MTSNDISPLSPVTAVGEIRFDFASRQASACVMDTVSVRQFEEESARLRELIRDIKASLDDESFFNQHTRHVVELIKGLSRQVAEHFSLEEAGNCYAGSEAVTLELAGLADALRSEHRTLAAEIDGIVEQAESLVPDAVDSESSQRRIASRIRVYCRRLRDHERRENELLLQAYSEDVGVGD